MVQFNFFRREVNCKIVYYGPGLSGKTTNLEVVHKKTPNTNRGELTSIATEQDRTLFFDFMPIDLGTVAGMKTKLRLFTVPGQVFYNSTRKLVLQGADGVIFVADSQKHKQNENMESLKNLEENLREHGLEIKELPLVIQWNKRDMPTALPVAELERTINYLHVPTFEGVAVTGEGVFPTLKKCAALVLESLRDIDPTRQGRGGAKPGLGGKPGLKAGGIGSKGGPRLQPRLKVAPAAKPMASGLSKPGVPGVPGVPGKSMATGKPIFKKFKKFGRDQGGNS